MNSISGVLKEHRRRIAEAERIDEENFQIRIAHRRYKEEMESLRYQIRNSSSKTLTPALKSCNSLDSRCVTHTDLGPFSSRILDKFTRSEASTHELIANRSWKEEASVSPHFIKSVTAAKSNTLNALKLIESSVFTEYTKSWNDPVVRHNSNLFKGISFINKS